ncbi:hypothetical protein Hanom_Chr16g01451911 [Helianthus anomalus]
MEKLHNLHKEKDEALFNNYCYKQEHKNRIAFVPFDDTVVSLKRISIHLCFFQESNQYGGCSGNN